MSVSVSVFGVDTLWHKKEESLKLVGVPGFFMELLARFELATVLPQSRLCGSPYDLMIEICLRQKRMRSPVLAINEKRTPIPDGIEVLLELLARFELATSSLPRMRSTG